MFFMFLIIKLNVLNVNMFFKIFFKKIFSYIPGRNFFALLHVMPCVYMPRNFFVFTTRDATLLCEFSRFFEQFTQMHKYAYARLVPKKSTFPEYGNLYNYLHLSGIKFALCIIINFYPNQKINCIQFLYCM